MKLGSILVATLAALVLAPSAMAGLGSIGGNEDGALCDGIPFAEQAYSSIPAAASSIKPTAIAGGEQFVVFLGSEGKVYTCGSNEYDQLGVASPASSDTPVALPLEHVVNIAAGEHFAMALLSNGSVVTWGATINGTLYEPQFDTHHLPEVVPGLVATSIGAGPASAAAVTSGGQVVNWGTNTYDQFCLASRGGGDSPVVMEGVSEAKQVEPALEDVYVLTAKGKVMGCSEDALTERANGVVNLWPGWTDGLAQTENGSLYMLEPNGKMHAAPITGAVQAASGTESFIALQNSKAYTWDGNLRGMLGIGVSEGGYEPCCAPYEVKDLPEPVTVIGQGLLDNYVGGGGAPAPKVLHLTKWSLAGSSLKDKKLGQSFNFPVGEASGLSALYGNLNTSFSTGTFRAPLEWEGLTVASLGLNIGGAITGNTEWESATEAKLRTTGTEQIGIEYLSMLGLKIPTSCESKAKLYLTGHQSLTSLESEVHLNGTSAIGKFSCHSGLLGLGGLLGEVFTMLLSGEGNSTTVVVTPLSAKPLE